jgi:hypothetical protein
MELLTSPKSKYLLEAGIEVLHQQSNEWRSEVAFWKDEVAFYYALVVRKTMKEISANVQTSVGTIEGELTKITEGELEELQQEVDLHEYFLSKMLESRKEDQQDYREKHRQLSIKFEAFENRFKILKKDIFKLLSTVKNTAIPRK